MFSAPRFFRPSLILAVALAACGGGDKGTTPTPTPQGFTVALSSTTLSVEQGASGTVTATIGRTGSFAGTVNLSTESVPTGITAAFSPAAVTSGTTSTTLTVTVAASVTPGPYSFTIRGQAAGINDQRTATVSMTVTAKPAIAMVLAPTSASVQQGSSGSFAATIARTNFTGAVAVAITGAPAGATATVTNAADVYTVALAVGAAVVPGAYTLTATATGTGVTSVTAPFALTVTAAPASGIVLSATPASLTAQAGGPGQTATINIARTSFAGAVSLGVLSGVPAGVTTSIVTSPTTANSATVTFTAGASTAPGAYTVVMQGTGTGIPNATVQIALTVTAAAGSIALSTNPATVAAVAGGAGVNYAINIVRTAFTGPVTIAATGLPAGATASFATSPTTGTSVTGTFTAGLTTVPGTYPITLTGSGTGITSATVQINLTVTAAAGIALSLSTNPLLVQQGQPGSTTVNITRNQFTSVVAFTISGLPTGVTASFNTASTTTNSSVLTLAVAGTVATGTYGPLTITGTGQGIANATIDLTLTVTPAAGGGNIVYSFCGATDIIPIWFAAQSGANGTWTRVTAGANNTYTFSIAGVGGVAFVTQNAANNYDLTIQYGTQAELSGQGSGGCVSPSLKTVTGTVTGFGATNSDFIFVSFGSAPAFPPPTFPTPNFTIANAPDGNRDLMGTRSTLDTATSTLALNKIFLKRGLNPANGGSVGTVDFESATDAFAPDTRQITINGSITGEQLSVFTLFTTANGTLANLSFGATGSNPFSFLAVPSSRTVAGDVTTVFASAATMAGNTLTAARSVVASFRDPVNQSVTLGAALSTPTVTVVGLTPYVKLRTQLQRQSDYQSAWSFNYAQTLGSTDRSVSIGVSAGYLGSAVSLDISIPDFTGAAGWQSTWGLQQGAVTSTDVGATGFISGSGGFTDGAIFRTATRHGSLTP